MIPRVLENFTPMLRPRLFAMGSKVFHYAYGFVEAKGGGKSLWINGEMGISHFLVEHVLKVFLIELRWI